MGGEVWLARIEERTILPGPIWRNAATAHHWLTAAGRIELLQKVTYYDVIGNPYTNHPTALILSAVAKQATLIKNIITAFGYNLSTRVYYART